MSTLGKQKYIFSPSSFGASIAQRDAKFVSLAGEADESLWDDTKKLADAENKTPVIALCQKNRKGFWIVVHEDDLQKVMDAKNNN